MSDRVFASGSYGEALCIIGEYVNITDSEPEHKLKKAKTAVSTQEVSSHKRGLER